MRKKIEYQYCGTCGLSTPHQVDAGGNICMRHNTTLGVCPICHKFVQINMETEICPDCLKNRAENHARVTGYKPGDRFNKSEDFLI